MGSIRFILAVSVLIAHSSPIFSITILPGYLAVQSFYIISGFYMGLVFTEKYQKTERPVWNFYSNRLLRIMPLYWLIVLLILGLSLTYGITLSSYGKIQYYLDWYLRQPDSLGSLANRFPKPLGTGAPLFVFTIIFSVLVYKYFMKPLERYREDRLKV
jgi:peptidoglycan/LPS O-acetylase OafA/YrhL